MRDSSLWFRNCFARGSRTVPALRIFALVAVIAFEAADRNEGVSSDTITGISAMPSFARSRGEVLRHFGHVTVAPSSHRSPVCD